MKRVECYCLFDITCTGVTNQRRTNSWPITANDGQIIDNERALHYARNQQRNWDTITQLISLRTQPFNLTNPKQIKLTDPASAGFDRAGPLTAWHFEFEIEFADQWRENDDELFRLKQDTNGVPMIIGLEESDGIGTLLNTNSSVRNIVYSTM
jgi:hypothetical protein